MGIFIGYYESSIKNALKCAREFLLFSEPKNWSSDIVSGEKKLNQCVTEIVPFKSLKAFCIGLRCLHLKQASIICTGLLPVPPPEADLA